MSNVIEAIQKRSSTRGYTAESLTEEELDVLLQAGLQAPTAANRQEVHFTVLKGDHPLLAELEEDKNRLRKETAPAHNFYYEAPLVIILSADSANRWGELDAGIAVENMALAAEGLGLGNVIIGCIHDSMMGEKKEYFSKAMRFPENYEFKVAIACGHKAVSKEPHTFDAAALVTRL